VVKLLANEKQTEKQNETMPEIKQRKHSNKMSMV